MDCRYPTNIEVPLVSCIMPTSDRCAFVAQAIKYFQRQDYCRKELIIVDDGSMAVSNLVPEDPQVHYIRSNKPIVLGEKRNLACEQANGEIILHWDDDDWMAPWRISYQLKQLLESDADICGLDALYCYSPVLQKAWQYSYPKKQHQLLSGGSLCYKKDYWKRHAFAKVNVGEDSRFVWSEHSKKIHVPAKNSFYVAIHHDNNISKRNYKNSGWKPCSTRDIKTILGEDWKFYNKLYSKKGGSGNNISRQMILPMRNPEVYSKEQPIVSCIMPTRDRRWCVPQAIKYYFRQDYPNKELIIVDDGDKSIEDLVPESDQIKYVRLLDKKSAGFKRNLAVQYSQGEIIAHWDDDDWYADDRISYQLGPLLNNDAEISGLRVKYIYDVARNSLWSCSSELHKKLFFADVHGRSLMYKKKLWLDGANYPEKSLSEDVVLLKKALNSGSVRLSVLNNTDKVIYIRHHNNTWKFDCGSFIDCNGWRPTEFHANISADDRAFYYRYWQQNPMLEHETSLIISPGTQAGTNNQKIEAKKSGLSNRWSNMDAGADHVTVSIPYFHCRSTIRKAVESVLAQTHKNLSLIVVNNDDDSPWPLLADINDTRLIRFDAQVNYGRYFSDAVVLNATNSPYFLIQDADDWSEPSRIAMLMYYLKREHAVGAVSEEHVYYAARNSKQPATERYNGLGRPLSIEFQHRANHHGLFLTAALKEIGGYYGGFRIGYDTLLINFLMMTGRLICLGRPLYNRVMRSESLSNAATTGMTSQTRFWTAKQLRQMYTDAFVSYERYLKGDLKHGDLCKDIRKITSRHIRPKKNVVLITETQRLRKVLQKNRYIAEPAMENEVLNIDKPSPDLASLPWAEWSIDKRFARRLRQHLDTKRPRRILEVGSGVSTLILADYAKHNNAKIVSLEHDSEYYQRTGSLLRDHALLDYVELRLAPLHIYDCADGHSYYWYSTKLSGYFDFVFIDGPPERFGRQAALFAIKPNLDSQWELWLHDGNRPHEQNCIALWSDYFEFSEILSQSDPKGVFYLKGENSAASKFVCHSANCGLGISILAGERPLLLMRAIETLKLCNMSLLNENRVIALVNGSDEKSLAYLERQIFVDQILEHKSSVLSIGAATSMLVETLAQRDDVQFIMHLEDDWEFGMSDSNWLNNGLNVLREYAGVGQVRLRHFQEKVLPYHMLNKRPIIWKHYDQYSLASSAHYTFNPSIIRARDVDKIFPCESELEAQRNFLASGLGVAQILPGVFSHIGGKYSRREKVESELKLS